MVKVIERIIYKEDHSFEKVSKKVEISGKIIGETMLAGIMNLDGWRLAIKDNEHETTLIITGEDEAAITQIKNLLAKIQQLYYQQSNNLHLELVLMFGWDY